MSALPTADEIARAVVQACFECDEDPLAVMAGDGSKARIYAFAAVKELFPLAGVMRAAAWFGAKSPATLVGQGNTSIRMRWWDDALLARVKAAVRGGVDRSPSRAIVRRPAVPSATAPTPQTRAAATRRAAAVTMAKPSDPPVPPRGPLLSPKSVTAGMMGDPLPGRSALAQGYTPGSGLVRERA